MTSFMRFMCCYYYNIKYYYHYIIISYYFLHLAIIIIIIIITTVCTCTYIRGKHLRPIQIFPGPPICDEPYPQTF